VKRSTGETNKAARRKANEFEAAERLARQGLLTAERARKVISDIYAEATGQRI
jgi:hypothetical protein